jgi:membrane associated rhomboid family serine protease
MLPLLPGIKTTLIMSDPDSSFGTERAFFLKKLRLSMLIPGIIVFMMWLLKISELLFELDPTRLGIFPLSVKGLPGIIFSPFIHSGFRHLFNNTLPLFFLGSALFYFYSGIAVRVSLWTWFLTGLSVWLAGRPAWHIGASGLIYGLASFCFSAAFYESISDLSPCRFLLYSFTDQWCGVFFLISTRMFPGNLICLVLFQELYFPSFTGRKVLSNR